MVFRDGMQGAKPKARLHALPGFATPQTTRKTTGPSGWGEIGRFAHQIPCMGRQPMLRNVGEQLIPIASQRDLKLSTDKFLVDQLVSNGQPNQPRHVVHAQFGHQATAVGGYRLGRQVEFLANFGAGFSCHHHDNDLALSR